MTDSTLPIDDAVRDFSLEVWRYKQGELVSLMIHLGDRLGLYRALRGAGPVTSQELAEKTGLEERWLREWLRGQGAAGLVEYRGDGRFELTDVQAAVLADENQSLFFAAGAFGEPMEPENVGRLADAFRTGVGLSYEQHGECACHRTERMLGPWTRLALVPHILPKLDGVVQKLERGARVLDVGCGGGIALCTLAQAFPESEFHGLDPSSHAIASAEKKKADLGLDNAAFHRERGENLEPEPKWDFVLTFDCIHDMTRPDLVIAAIRSALADDGTWLIKDIKSHPVYEKNFRNPMLALLYGFSIAHCMSAALSEPDGMGLGTLGFNPAVAERMCTEAGFSRFQMHDFDDPSNLYYEVRP